MIQVGRSYFREFSLTMALACLGCDLDVFNQDSPSADRQTPSNKTEDVTAPPKNLAPDATKQVSVNKAIADQPIDQAPLSNLTEIIRNLNYQRFTQ